MSWSNVNRSRVLTRMDLCNDSYFDVIFPLSCLLYVTVTHFDICAAFLHPCHWPVPVLCALLLDGLHLLLRVPKSLANPVTRIHPPFEPPFRPSEKARQREARTTEIYGVGFPYNKWSQLWAQRCHLLMPLFFKQLCLLLFPTSMEFREYERMINNTLGIIEE